MSELLAVTTDTFDREVLACDLPVAVDFWASWCAPCRAVAPVLAELADVYAGRMRFVSVDTEREEALARRYGIVSLPTLYVFAAGALVGALPGARNKAGYAAALDTALAEAAAL